MKLLPIIHQWMSLVAVTVWLIMAVSGVVLVFHGEIRDSLSYPHRSPPTDMTAIEKRLALLTPAQSGKYISLLLTTAGLPDRYEVTISEAKTGAVLERVRILGNGEILSRYPNGDFDLFRTIIDVHHTLAMGELGRWIMGISGLLLLGNIFIALHMAWPHRSVRWKNILIPLSKGPKKARLYSWHRAIGFWFAIPILLVAGAGTAIVFRKSSNWLLGIEASERPIIPPVKTVIIPVTQAVAVAEEHVPGGKMTGVWFPDINRGAYRIVMLEPGEARRAYGSSSLLIDARTGKLLYSDVSSQWGLNQIIANGFFTLHTGELAGLPGRITVMLSGFLLATGSVVGLMLWKQRKRPKAR